MQKSGRPTNIEPKTTSAPATPSVGEARAAESARPFAGKRVAVTYEELKHVLSELPSEYTQNLLGDNKQRVKDLDTAIWAIDFDGGPAEFWLKTSETGPKTFPVRLPEKASETWRIPTTKAHVLMWFQPHESVGMADRVKKNLNGPFGNSPGCVLGVDVDGKPVARIDRVFSVFQEGPFSETPPPLWFGWPLKDVKDMLEPDTEFASEMGPQAIFLTGRKTNMRGIEISCQLALLYRPDLAVKKRDP